MPPSHLRKRGYKGTKFKVFFSECDYFLFKDIKVNNTLCIYQQKVIITSCAKKGFCPEYSANHFNG